jgi:hypothetical protein
VKGSETAPFLYVEDFWDASWAAGIVKFRLARFRRADGPGERDFWEVVAVLAMSVKNLAESHRYIGTVLERMKETGDYVEEASRDRP